ncbi:hypothetical protein OTK49_02460 [Vibrio coralliirubri]|uniref:hypothetical protein n=1 Tax=Vibrio coralliirubri TaxID=1516159 RepID=UPI002284EAD8|nr:hypothetical protein [Vibrio coralliirubri]MCY9861379.1 hypothetical protein [Vibrio coralliirubri]
MSTIRDQLSQEELKLISKALIRSKLASRVVPIVNGLFAEKTFCFGDGESLNIDFNISDSIQNKGGKESCYSIIMSLTSSLEPHLSDVYAISEIFSDSSKLKRYFLNEHENHQLVNSWSAFCGFIREGNPQLLKLIRA